jgi:hypothetical protein
MKISIYRNAFLTELRFFRAGALFSPAGRSGIFRKISRLAFYVFPIFLLNSSCNKSSGVNKNKAFVTVAHVAPGFSNLDVLYNGASILGDTGLDYNEISGTPENPYVEATAGVRLLQITGISDTILQGNTAFQQGLHYSVFLYDTLKNDSLKMFILQDNLQLYRDTITYVRFMNFSPGPALNVVLAGKYDTIATGFQEFAGNRLKTSFYTYKLMPIGLYEARAWRDTVAAHSISLGNIQIDSLKNYSLFLQGYADSSGEYGLKLKSIRQN